MPKKTVNLKLSEREAKVLGDLADAKDLSQSAVLRQALRLYQLIDHRLSAGERMYFENDLRKMEFCPLLAPTLEDNQP